MILRTFIVFMFHSDICINSDVQLWTAARKFWGQNPKHLPEELRTQTKIVVDVNWFLSTLNHKWLSYWHGHEQVQTLTKVEQKSLIDSRTCTALAKYHTWASMHPCWGPNLGDASTFCNIQCDAFRADTIDQMMQCIVFMSVTSTPVHMQCLQLRCNVFSSDALYSPLSQCFQSVCNVFRSFASAPVHMQCVQSVYNVLRSLAISSGHLHQLQSVCNVFMSDAMSSAPLQCLQLQYDVFICLIECTNCCNLNLSPCS